ncbi:MAG: hypothetical protein ACTHN5_22060 [Phycisphaerae bacterium]
MAMRTVVRIGAVCVCAGMWVGAGAATQPGAMGAGDVQALYDGGKFAEAVAGAKRVLGMRNVPVEDRHVVMILLAESHLQLKQGEQAVAVLQQGHRQAVTEERPRDAAEAEAFALLIPASTGNVYTAKGEGSSGKYNILVAAERKEAYGAMFEDKMKHLEALKEQAQGATTMKPVQEIAKEFPAVRELEEAGTGAVKKSDAFADGVERWAGRIIVQTLNGYDGRISRIQLDSNVNALGRFRPRKPAGISDGDRAELHQIIADCRQVPQTIQEFTAAFHRPWPMQRALNQAKDLAQRAERTLEENKRVGTGKG